MAAAVGAEGASLFLDVEVCPLEAGRPAGRRPPEAGRPVEFRPLEAGRPVDRVGGVRVVVFRVVVDRVGFVPVPPIKSVPESLLPLLPL